MNSPTMQKRINKATIQIKAIIGFEYCVCWLTNGHPPKLMISNIPHGHSDVEESIIEAVTQVLFPNLEFEIETKEIGSSIVALIFKPV